MDERAIRRLTSALGRQEAAAVDADRVAAHVVRRLARGRPVRRLARWVGAAAAAVVALVAVNQVLAPGPSAPALVPPVALGEVDPAVLDAALDSLQVAGPVPDDLGGGLGTLTVEELQQLLATMEG